jgi:hypothetical protein
MERDNWQTTVLRRWQVSEPRYLSGDEYALTGGYEDLVNCKECAVEYDRTEYRSDTCSDCEDEMIMRERVRANG